LLVSKTIHHMAKKQLFALKSLKTASRRSISRCVVSN
jgi:hypothetical protein